MQGVGRAQGGKTSALSNDTLLGWKTNTYNFYFPVVLVIQERRSWEILIQCGERQDCWFKRKARRGWVVPWGLQAVPSGGHGHLDKHSAVIISHLFREMKLIPNINGGGGFCFATSITAPSMGSPSPIGWILQGRPCMTPVPYLGWIYSCRLVLGVVTGCSF